MTVAEALLKYLQAKEQGEESDQDRIILAGVCEDLFKALQRARLRYDLSWWTNERFIDGDHDIKTDRDSGQVVVNPKSKKRHRRTINLMKVQIRGLKNTIMKIPITAEVDPENDTEPAVKAAQGQNSVWQAIEYNLKVRNLLRPVVHDGFVKSAGYLGVLPTSDGYVRMDHYDTFCAYPDPTAPTLQDGHVFHLATPQNLQGVKDNKDYENTADLQGDNRLAASDYKDSYEKQKLGGQTVSGTGDLTTVIWKQLFVKFPYTQVPVTKQITNPQTGEVIEQPVLGQDGQPQKTIQPTPDGKPRMWIITHTGREVHRVEETSLTKFPVIPYYPEKSSNKVYLPAWVDDLRPINKIINNLMALAEEWHMKAKPKLLVPSDSKLKEVKDTTAEVLEYNRSIPGDGIKDYMPSGLPDSIFKLLDVSRAFIGDIGGGHESTLGVRPQGVTAARAIESLKANDAEANMSEPLENLGLFYQEVVERVFEYLSENQTTQKTLSYQDNGTPKTVSFIGQAGLKDGQEAPEGTVVVRPAKVHVTVVPAIAYTEQGRMETVKEMYRDGLVPREYVLETYRVGNVQEIADKAAKEQADKAKQGTPPPPPPADRLLNALANLRKSGEFISPEQLDTAMQDAGLPPSTPPPPVAPPGPGVPPTEQPPSFDTTPPPSA